MAEIAIRPALSVTPLRGPGDALVLEPLADGRLVHALAASGAPSGTLPERLARIADGAAHAVRPYAPDQWFVISDAPLAPGELRRFAGTMGEDVALSDQSHGRVLLAVSGPAARSVLAKGTGVDLSDAMFPIGRSAQSLFGHVGIHVTRVAADRYELIVLRSLAESLWKDLAQAGSEFLTGPSSPR